MGFYILVDGLSHYFYMGSLACPARFERATYPLEALKMRLNKPKNNDIEVLISAEARPLND
jgi:hypothetical protein